MLSKAVGVWLCCLADNMFEKQLVSKDLVYGCVVWHMTCMRSCWCRKKSLRISLVKATNSQKNTGLGIFIKTICILMNVHPDWGSNNGYLSFSDNDQNRSFVQVAHIKIQQQFGNCKE